MAISADRTELAEVQTPESFARVCSVLGDSIAGMLSYFSEVIEFGEMVGSDDEEDIEDAAEQEEINMGELELTADWVLCGEAVSGGC